MAPQKTDARSLVSPAGVFGAFAVFAALVRFAIDRLLDADEPMIRAVLGAGLGGVVYGLIWTVFVWLVKPRTWREQIGDRARWRRRGGLVLLATAVPLFAAMLVVALGAGEDRYAVFFAAALLVTAAVAAWETARRRGARARA